MTTQHEGDFSVQRQLTLASLRADEMAAIEACLLALPGMQQIEADVARRRLRLVYDAAQLGFGQIEQALRAAGFAPQGGRWSRWRSAWYRYLDENARANAAARGGACCSNPSDVYARRHR